MRIFLLFVVLMAIFSVFAIAPGISATAAGDSRNIEAGGEAVFAITIKNDQVREDIFGLGVSDFAVSPFLQLKKITGSRTKTYKKRFIECLLIV